MIDKLATSSGWEDSVPSLVTQFRLLCQTLHVAYLLLEVVQFLLDRLVLLGHLLVLLFPLIASRFQSLYFSLVVASFDICLT
jgi:hypothetical protein